MAFKSSPHNSEKKNVANSASYVDTDRRMKIYHATNTLHASVCQRVNEMTEVFYTCTAMKLQVSTHTNNLTSVFQTEVAAWMFHSLTCWFIKALLSVQEITKWKSKDVLTREQRRNSSILKEKDREEKSSVGSEVKEALGLLRKGPGHTLLSLQTH